MSHPSIPAPRLIHGRYDAAGSVLGPLLAGVRDPRLYPALSEWCLAQDPVPDAIVTLITDLYTLDPESPVLARLAAWVRPTPARIQTLAHWESRWHLLDPRWTEAFLRWMRGAPRTEEDAVILGELLERSLFTKAVQLAVQRNRRAARRALHIALRCTLDHPIERVILETWNGAFGQVQ